MTPARQSLGESPYGVPAAGGRLPHVRAGFDQFAGVQDGDAIADGSQR